MAEDRIDDVRDEDPDETAPDQMPDAPPEAPPESPPSVDPESGPETLEPEGREGEKPASTAPAQTSPDASITCPWCGTAQEMFLEPSTVAGEQEFVEGCRECGREYEATIETTETGETRVDVRRPQ